MSVAPIAISFILACHTSPDPADVLGLQHWNSSAGVKTREWLQAAGLIDENNRTTSRGDAWVRFLCETPLPVQQWVRFLD